MAERTRGTYCRPFSEWGCDKSDCGKYNTEKLFRCSGVERVAGSGMDMFELGAMVASNCEQNKLELYGLYEKKHGAYKR